MTDLTTSERNSISRLRYTEGGQALLKLASAKEDYWIKKLIHADSNDVAENSRLRAKIFAYQRLQDFLKMEEVDENGKPVEHKPSDR